MLKNILHKNFSILLILICWFVFTNINNTWKKTLIESDVLGYHGYLPALFLCKDIKLTKPECAKYWWVTAENGTKIFKYSSGMALLYLPSYLAAKTYCELLNLPPDPFSKPFENMHVVFGFTLFLYGSYCLLQFLKTLYSNAISNWTLIIVYASTNVLWYTTGAPLLTHAYSFSLVSILLYLITTTSSFKLTRLIQVALIAGFITIIRPINVIILLALVCIGIQTKTELLHRFKLFFPKPIYTVIALICFVLPLVPQLIYWKITVGKFVYYSYLKESFYFNNPHLIAGLFSYRKGWLLYTPIMALSLIGIPLLKKHKPSYFLSVAVFTAIFFYVTFSWWYWSYGGTYSQRTLIDFYPILSISLAASLTYLLATNKIVTLLSSMFIILLTCLNFFQVYQYSEGIIHFDNMSKESYWAVFGKKKIPADYYGLIAYPDIYREFNGKPAYYTENDIHSTSLNIKAIVSKYWSSLKLGNGKLCTTVDKTGLCEFFKIEKIAATNSYAIKSYDGLYVVANNDTLSLTKTTNANAVFELQFLGGNKIALKAANKKYVTVTPDAMLVTNSDNVALGNIFVVQEAIDHYAHNKN